MSQALRPLSSLFPWGKNSTPRKEAQRKGHLFSCFCLHIFCVYFLYFLDSIPTFRFFQRHIRTVMMTVSCRLENPNLRLLDLENFAITYVNGRKYLLLKQTFTVGTEDKTNNEPRNCQCHEISQD